MKKYTSFVAYALLAILSVSCSVEERPAPEDKSPLDGSDRFRATFETLSDDGTRVYTDKDRQVLWHQDDRVTIFNKYTFNREYRFLGKTGDNSGEFEKIDNGTFVTGNELDHIYAIYPYQSSTTIDNEGLISFEISPTQHYAKDTFGPGANTMVSVSDDNRLLFRNTCGYLCLKLYGEATVGSIQLHSNGKETLAGTFSVQMNPGGIPVLTPIRTQSSSDFSIIQLLMDSPVALGSSPEECTEFWFVIPPRTFPQGFTIDIFDATGKPIFKKYTRKNLEIKRNTVCRMAAAAINSTDYILDDIYLHIGHPNLRFGNVPDDWSILTNYFSNDLEGSDALIEDNNYNWFNTCGLYTSRTPTYRNPSIRYYAPMGLIAKANNLITSYPDNETILAQARALRAYANMVLAPQYQFAPQTFVTSQGSSALDLPCIPLVTPDSDETNNPRATVREIYEFILTDLDYAVQHLDESGSSKKQIGKNAAHGLRARVNLILGNWQAAYDDAVHAAQGYTPASISEMSHPAFMDIHEHNWIWGFEMPPSYPLTVGYFYSNTSTWLRSFSSNSYAMLGCYTRINKMLWKMIPDTDVRKGWWVDEELHSPLLEGLTWVMDGISVSGQDIAPLSRNGKVSFTPYTNVKFGCRTVGTEANDEDMPLMRVEEMILIQAEAQARLGNTSSATSILENFVRTYRDPSYRASGRGLALLDEIWFQRRVELWGEGFGVTDNLRLNKPIVRFLGTGESTNMPQSFRFNIDSQDPWLLMRFPSTIMDYNSSLVNNTGGSAPVSGQNPDLRDGVTD